MTTLLKNRMIYLEGLLKKKLFLSNNNGLYSLSIENDLGSGSVDFLFDGTEKEFVDKIRVMTAGYRFGVASVKSDS